MPRKSQIVGRSDTKNGYVLGYDPGGNGTHGVAALGIRGGRPEALEATCCQTAEKALEWLVGYPDPLALGVDTLLAWSGAKSGYRGADLALRGAYEAAEKSVVAPNSLYGAMTLSGAWVASKLVAVNRRKPPSLFETHPKVLYFARWRAEYNWDENSKKMVAQLRRVISPATLKMLTKDHEFDAALSAYAAFEALFGDWSSNDLLREEREQLIFPAGPATYPWPEPV